MTTTVTTTIPVTTVEPVIHEIINGLQVLVPYFSCIAYSDAAVKQAEAEGYCETYIVSTSGLYRKTGLTHGRSVTVPCAALPTGTKLPACSQDVSKFFPAGKIPIKLLHEIVAFFKAVMVENKGVNLEAMAFVIWNPILGYHIRIPEQTVSGAAVSYNWVGFMSPEDVICLDFHSHNNMSAFFSGTDDNDDRGNCYVSGVVGKISSTMEMVFRFNLPGSMKIEKLPMDQIFAQPEENFEVPKEWMGQVKRQVYVAPVYTPRTNYGSSQVGGRGVVPNPGFQGHRVVSGMELSDSDMEVLQQFGHPFAFEEEGNQLPFSSRPLTQGRKNGSKNGNKKSTKGARLPRKPISRNVIS